MPDLGVIESHHVTAAINDVVHDGVPEGRRSRKFCLVAGGRHLPPKYVVGLAHQRATGAGLSPEEYSGGEQSNALLDSLGFVIAECGCGGTTPAPAAKGARTATTAALSTVSTARATAVAQTEARPRTTTAGAAIAPDATRTFRVALVLPQTNPRHVERLTDPRRYQGKGIQLVVFPEAWLGDEQGARVTAIRDLARAAEVPVLAGLSHPNGEQQLLLFPAGGGAPTKLYVKHSSARAVAFRDPAWTANTRLPVVTIGGVRVGVTICHDHYLGLLQRHLGAQGAEVWINPSYDLVTDEKWGNILRLRAVENGFAALCTLHADGDGRAHPFGFSRSGVALSGREIGDTGSETPLDQCRQTNGIFIVDVPLGVGAARDDLSLMDPNRKTPRARTGGNQHSIPLGMVAGGRWVECPSRLISFDHPIDLKTARLMFFAIDGDELLRPEIFWRAIARADAEGARPVFWNHWDRLPADRDRLVSLMLGRSLECMAPVVLSDVAGIYEVTEVANASKVLRRVDLGEVPVHLTSIDVGKALGWKSAFKMTWERPKSSKSEQARARRLYLSLA